MDVFLTVISGAAVFVTGQAIMKFWLEPWHEYRMLVGKIAHALILYPNANADPALASPTPVDEARRELRSLAGQLWQRTHAIPFYGLLSRACPWIPTREEIRQASGGLIGLSKSLGDHWGKSEYIAKVRDGLHMYNPDAPIPPRRTLSERITGSCRKRKP